MKLLLLIPNLVLLSISGYNLYAGFTAPQTSNYLVYTLLHLMVGIICLTFIGLIVKSMFKIQYTERPAKSYADNVAYAKINLQHQTAN